jgi:hypothetical protein
MTMYTETVSYTIDFKVGDKVNLRTYEPINKADARAKVQGNYVPHEYVGEVEEISNETSFVRCTVRWHLPAALGYDPEKRLVSKLIHIANGVWLECRKRPRNVVLYMTPLSAEAYERKLGTVRSKADT